MISKKKILIKSVASLAFCATVIFVGAQGVQADTSAKTKVAVTVKTSELKVNKTITSPKKVVVSSTSSSNRNNTSTANRAVNSSSNQLVNYALRFRGVPYVYGANGPSAFDCSGYTSYVFRHFGVSLPRTAKSQYSAGSSVSKGNLAPGDLVFFNTVGYLGHVGIYIGNGNFVHASTSSGVKISSLSEGYYSSRYAGARRVY